jgi:hypothetical protein
MVSKTRVAQRLNQAAHRYPFRSYECLHYKRGWYFMMIFNAYPKKSVLEILAMVERDLQRNGIV